MHKSGEPIARALLDNKVVLQTLDTLFQVGVLDIPTNRGLVCSLSILSLFLSVFPSSFSDRLSSVHFEESGLCVPWLLAWSLLTVVV